MRLMMMHKNDAKTEAHEPLPPGLFEKMGAYVGEHLQRGTFLDGAGLGASDTRTRLTFRGGVARIQHGPYAGGHELPAAALMLTVRDRDEAIGWAERYGKILGDGEIELGPINEPWDLGFGTKPDGAPLRVLLLEKADADTEAGTRSRDKKAALTRLKTEMQKAGVLVSAERLTPSAQGKRLMFTNNDLRVLDGPFSESKELIGGFAMMRFDTIDEAITEMRRYAEILGGTLELDVRPLEEPEAD